MIVEIDICRNLFNTIYGVLNPETGQAKLLIDNEPVIPVEWDAERGPFGMYVPAHKG